MIACRSLSSLKGVAYMISRLINIFSTALFNMQGTYAVGGAIDLLLDKGAHKLYDKYLDQKLPDHTQVQNSATFDNNIALHQVSKPNRDPIESVPLVIIQKVPIDTCTPHKVPLKKTHNPHSTLSPKNTTFARSTNYQTIDFSHKSNIERPQNPQIANDSLFLEEPFRGTGMGRNSDRPLTMQIGRKKGREVSHLELDSKLQQVQEKRAATCHVRKRKALTSSKEKKEKLIKLKEDIPANIRDEVEANNRLRKWKLEKQDEELKQQSERAKLNAYRRFKEKKSQEEFQDLKNKLKGKSKVPIQITNFQSNNGEITINGNRKVQKAAIVQLEFKPQEERTLQSPEPVERAVEGKKKSNFVTKLKAKLKLTNDEYTNNGGRQISSIPFMTLNYGISLSQSILQATASRRRPAEEISREQFSKDIIANRFKSHIPIVNSARLSFFATIDQSCKNTARSSFCEAQLSAEKEFESTFESKKQDQESILWRRRGKADTKKIRICNQIAYSEAILDNKLVK